MVKCPHAAKGCNYPEGDCPGHCLVDNGLRQHQSEALRLADLIDANLAGAGDAEISSELRRLHAENEDFRATCDHLTRENAEQIGEIVALKERRDELLEALRQAAMWLPILTKMAGLDAEETQVELSDFQDDPSRPPETITIASSMTAACTAIAKAKGAA